MKCQKAGILRFLFLSIASLLTPPALSEAYSQGRHNRHWGLGIYSRFYTIPYNTSLDSIQTSDHTNKNVTPLLYFQSDYFYLDGEEGGFHLLKDSNFELNAIAKMQLIDIPEEYQNKQGGVTGVYGFEMKQHYDQNIYFSHNLLSDPLLNPVFAERLGYIAHTKNWRIEPSTELRINSPGYNKDVFGLELEDIGMGAYLKSGVELRYHVISDLYLYAHTYLTMYDHNICKSRYMNNCYQYEYALGFIFSESPDSTSPYTKEFSQQPKHQYLRVAYGVGVEAAVFDIMSVSEKVTDVIGDDRLTSLFYGYRVSENFMNAPIDVYPTVGFAHHFASTQQKSAEEIIVSIKLYLKIPWPTKMRLGFAEGLSYLTNIGTTEMLDMKNDGEDYTPSKLSNYLDISYDFNIGDLFVTHSLDNLWIGYGIHHRSGIFSAAAQYGRISGGVNHHTIYAQYDF